ncbi:uncharacterized protein LOC118191603 [Stegodyphus dumicola]|uniref:uncharacterized protein LOC118191603 n=2 Tax=Stegodyphus dumicola TaxID=202533 RepID=UPI0015AE80D0|nr:uncharacterized protein LOC118191603 [Stegodyphus dumicola]
MVQEDCFVNEKDEKLRTLGVFKDQSGILRLKTKLTFREDTEDFKTPAILPSNHEVVKRLVRYYHEKNAHAGTQILINILRERFWILNARKTVRSIINQCTVCRRFSAKNLETCTGAPPEDRLREAAVFEICGVDLAGPVILKGNKKSWICLFTCAIYRAVHLELVESMSTESFLLALRRFIARRGRSRIIYCDNGTNFVGASNVLQDLNWKQITEDTSIPPIQWKFNPPTASWWGGWWERLIGILKKLLRRVLGRASLTSEEMNTTLCDCEAVINSRPLTYVTESDATLMPLSPSLFLQDNQISGVPDLDDIGHKSLNKRVKYRENLQKDLRNRFRSEYLGALIQKAGNKKSVKVNIGDIVLIGSDNTKRINWPLGKIIQILPGKDGITRLVKLKTANGHLLRPIQRLYPLEVSNDDPIIEKFSTAKVGGETCANSSFDNVCGLEPQIQKTRAGRTIKVPKRLDL